MSAFTPFAVVELLQYAATAPPTPNPPPTPPRQPPFSTASSVLAGLGASSSNLSAALASVGTSRSVITSIELCDANLYVGTSDGLLLHYILNRADLSGNDPPSDLEKTAYTKTSPGAGKRPLETILAFPTESKMVVFSDGTVTFLELDTLRQVQPVMCMPVKQTICFCADKVVQSPVPLAFARRKTLISAYLGDMLEMDKELPLMDGPVMMMVRHGSRICAADNQIYKLIFLETGESIPLFPYDRSLQRPLAAVYNDGEFLLVTATPQGLGLGMFISQNGEPIRGTLEWSAVPKSLAFQYPYVAGLLSNNTLEVHNVVNQQRMQTITFPAHFKSHTMVEATFDLELASSAENPGGTIKILVAGSDSVLGIKMAPLAAQVDLLLNAGNVEQAIELAEHISLGHPEEDTERKSAQLRSLYQRAGFICFERTDFDKALDLFKKAHLEPSLLTVLFPELDDEPASTTAKQEEAPATDWKRIDGIINSFLTTSAKDLDAEVLIGKARAMLAEYLISVRSTYPKDDTRLESIDMSLLKLKANAQSAELHAFLSSPDRHYPLEKAVAFLESNKRHYALSLVHRTLNKPSEVLQIWRRLSIKELVDPDFPGVAIVPDYLVHVDDKDLILETSTWLLDVDLPVGVQSLMHQVNDLHVFSREEVSSYLRQHSKAAYFLYLEHMVIERQDEQNQSFHTELATAYAEQVAAFGNSAKLCHTLERQYALLQSRPTFEIFLVKERKDKAEDPDSARFYALRLKLLRFLRRSASYDAQAVLKELKGLKLDLKAEIAIVLARTDDHDAALANYLALGDHVSAERFCVSQPIALRTTLFTKLFDLYLDSGDRMAQPVRNLLTQHHAHLDILAVLDAVPAHWSVALLADYLTSSMRASRSVCSENTILRNVARGQHTKVHARLATLIQDTPPLVLDVNDDNNNNEYSVLCAACGTPVPDPPAPFAARLLPRWEITHVHCR
ncbi:hypothetical protein DFJ77DRAFT_458246 [Powellomyces hirtus]|nr:hypothetical protein DFJ77DRAFT_458246 [Powellomyces hirtus]